MSSYKKAREAFVKKAKDKGIGEEDALSYFEL
jgi:hypothetical protein